MHIILTILLLVLILGIIILIHELGHFMWAKIFKVHIFEFSIGMGPVLYTHKGKDKIDYNLRAVPIGGFVSMAGEVYEDSENIPKKDFMCNKPWWQRIIILAAGVINNFISAIIFLFIMSLIWGGATYEPVVNSVKEGYPMANAGIKENDEIIKINGYNISSWDVAQIVLYMKDDDGIYDFTIKHEDGKIEEYHITPVKETNDEGKESSIFGVEIKVKETNGFFDNVKYAFTKFQSIMNSMGLTIYGLFSGEISLNALSGPVGMYEVVGQTSTYGVSYVIYLLAFLSINVGFINILPFPAFDGGHIFFLIVEKIKGSPVNAKFESTCHLIGFILLILLMIYVTIQDIIRIV